MPVPDIFTEHPDEERLAAYFEELYDYLCEEGVPEDRLPNPWHVLSRVVRCIDPERLREWLDAYSAVEADCEPEHPPLRTSAEHDEDNPRRPPRRRPHYLRMLDSDHPHHDHDHPEDGDPEDHDPPHPPHGEEEPAT